MNHRLMRLALIITILLNLTLSLKAQTTASKAQVPNLDFTEKDFVGNEGEKINETAKLPWNLGAIYQQFRSVKEVVYDVGMYSNGTKSGEQKRVFYDPYMQENILYISKQIKYSEDAKKDYGYNATDVDDSNREEKSLFPYTRLNALKVLGEENIENSLGEFACTVVEGIDTWGNKFKYWLINDKPGICARIIESEKGKILEYNLSQINK